MDTYLVNAVVEIGTGSLWGTRQLGHQLEYNYGTELIRASPSSSNDRVIALADIYAPIHIIASTNFWSSSSPPSDILLLFRDS